jgi:chromosomal replication initiator protein
VAVALVHCLREPDLSGLVTQAVGSAKFRLWFANARLAAEGGALVIATANRFVADWITSHFLEALTAAAQQHLGPEACVRVLVDSAADTPSVPVGNHPAVNRSTTSSAAASSSAASSSATSPSSAASPQDAAAASVSRHRRRRSADHATYAVANLAAEASASAVQPVVSRAPSSGSSSSDTSIRHISGLRYDLDSFTVGPCNELAYSAAIRLADDPNCRMSPLFIHGGCGQGKTHLLQGICRTFAHHNPGSVWVYATAEQFTNDYIIALRKNKLSDFRRKLRQIDLLAIDDVHFLASKTATQTEFLHTFNAIDLAGAKVVLASDAHPKTIQELADALVSRFVSGMVVEIQPPDRLTRRRIIASLCERRGMTLLDGVADTLAEQTVSSVREIEGMITRLAALASLDRSAGEAAGPIGHVLVQRLTGTSSLGHHRPVRLDHIIHAVCDGLAVERAQLMTRSRHRRVVLARSIAIYLARQLTTLSYPELAAALGRPNHSTIVTAAQRVEEQIRTGHTLPAADGSTGSLESICAKFRRRSIELANQNPPG